MTEEPATAAAEQASPPLRKWSWQYPEDFEAAPPEEKKRPSVHWFWKVVFRVLIWSNLLLPLGWGLPVCTTLVAVAAIFSFAEGVATFIRTRWVFRSIRLLLHALFLFTAALALVFLYVWKFRIPSPYLWIFAPLAVLILHRLVQVMERRLYPNESRLFDEAREAAGPWGRLLMRHIPDLRQRS